MIFRVRLIAFEDEPQIREVNVPNEEITGIVNRDLELIFHYGQNDFQPQRIRSVSVADVAELGGHLYVCAPEGWREITENDVQEILNSQPPGLRQFHEKVTGKT